jgi:DNA polymerase III gamma/tau subunit
MDVEREKADRDGLTALWSGLSGMSAAEVLALADAYAKDRERLDRLLDIGVERLRDLLVYRETGEERLLVRPEAGEGYRQRAERLPLPRMLADLELLTSSRTLLDRRVSAQLVAENLLFKLGRT